MYQESDDKLKGGKLMDTVLFIALIAFFFIAGGLATAMRAKFDTPLPLYAVAVIFAGLIYLVYRLRIVGWRYTVFYKEPEAEYDPRFGEEIMHEDYPYPVGTVVIEKTVSAKGEILAVIKREELIALLEPGANYAVDEEAVLGPKKKEVSSSIVFCREGRTYRAFFTPSEEFKGHVREIIDAK